MGARVEGSSEAPLDGGERRVAFAGEIVPVARRHRPVRGAMVSWLAACAGTLNIVAVMYLSSCAGAFEAGLRNADPPFLFVGAELLALVMWGIGGVVLVAMALTGPVSRRWFARGMLVVCAVAVPMGCYTRPMPDERYEEGFLRWVGTHVQVDAVRRWGATLPAVAVATPVGAGQWPAEVRAVSPAGVTQLPGGRGVVLEWGVLASWGTARRVVVCASEDGAPPRDAHFDWKQVGEGAYAAFEGRN